MFQEEEDIADSREDKPESLPATWVPRDSLMSQVPKCQGRNAVERWSHTGQQAVSAERLHKAHSCRL